MSECIARVGKMFRNKVRFSVVFMVLCVGVDRFLDRDIEQFSRIILVFNLHRQNWFLLQKISNSR